MSWHRFFAAHAAVLVVSALSLASPYAYAGDTAAPSVPSNLRATSVSSTVVELRWKASTDNVKVTGYYVYLNDQPLGTTTRTAFTHSGLQSGTRYTYRVSAYDAASNHSAWTEPLAVTTSGTAPADTTAPTVPTGLTAAASSSTQINLKWNPSTDNVAVTGYYVYLNDKPLTTTTTTSFSHTGLTAGTTYSYRVSAYDAASNDSAWSASVAATTPSATTNDTTAPTVPTGLTAAASSSTQINLKWNPSTDNVAVTGYYVYLNDKPLTTTTTTSFSHTGLTAGTTYNYRVSAYDAVPNHSAWTSSVAATTPSATTNDTTAPTVPTGLTAVASSSTQVDLKWNPSTDDVGVTGYYVYLNDRILAQTTTTTFSHTGLTAGTTYNYRVSAYDAASNDSAWTASVAATTPGGSSGTPQGDTGGLPVIPGAAGFGINTKAGRGGTVYRVTNLNASGDGSLKACTDASGPRVCIFEVSGTIYLTADIVIRNPYITIAGQTAPSPGITVRGAGINIATHDVLLQHLRVRPGDATTGPDPINRDAFKVEAVNGDSYNIVIDHVTGSWVTDEAISTWGSSTGKIYDVTIRNSIFSESLYDSISPDGLHSCGLLIGYRSSRVTVMNNLFAFVGFRNPLINADATDVMIVNNMLYRTRNYAQDQIDFGTTSSSYVPMRASVQGNHFVLAPGLSAINTINIRSNSAPDFKIFVKDNSGPLMTSDPWSVVRTNGRSISSLNSSTPPVWAPGVVAMPHTEVEKYVLAKAGARPLDRDPVDSRVITQVRNRTGGIINSPSDVGGYPTLAVNYRPLSLPADYNTVTASGYTNLELWLHEMARAVEGQ